MRHIGIDGCRAGWIAVAIDAQGRRDFAVLSSIAEIAQWGEASTMIDIPIGLPDAGRRGCDVAARALLGAARSRVFLDARRPLLGFADYPAANAWAKAAGMGISRQLWNILPKIAEIDRFIAPAMQETTREAHPELVFMRLGGGAALSGKKTAAGRKARRDLVEALGFAAIDRWLAALPPGAAADDLLDACALAHAALEPRRVPCARESDRRGLAMEIWY